MPLKCANLQRLEDGSIISADFGDVYFQRAQGQEESFYVFLEKNNLPARFAALQDGQGFAIAELGFGTGLNFLQTARLWQDTAPKGARLDFVSFEKHPIALRDLEDIYKDWGHFAHITQTLLPLYPPMIAGFHRLHFENLGITLTLALGDIADMLPQTTGLFDAWYLDGFAPAKNPQMWEDALYAHIANRTATGGTVSSFSAAGHVRRGLESVGFEVEKTKGFGIKRDMTIARFAKTQPPTAKPKTAAIIGAGIAGASVARALARRGVHVDVYDRHDSCAREASGNPVGIIYPKLTVDASPMGAYYQHAFCYTRNLLEALQLKSWQPCGVFRLDITAQDKERSQKLITRQDPPSDLVSHADKTAFGKSALYHALAGYLAPRDFCVALLDHPHIKTHYNADVQNWRQLGADIVILCMGNATKTPAETQNLPLRPLRGQISMVRANDLSQTLQKVVCHKGYIAPAVDGLHCIGATFQKEDVGNDDLRKEDHAENIATLNKNLPGFDFTIKDVVAGKAGFRATTPDKLPMAGHIVDNLYVLTGFGAHGLCGAPLIGEMLAAELCSDPAPVPAGLRPYFDPKRFKDL